MALTCLCPLGNISLLRGVYFKLDHPCNGWSDAACQVPLAQTEKIIPSTCCVPDVFCRISDLRDEKRQKVGGGFIQGGQEGERNYHIPI